MSDGPLFERARTRVGRGDGGAADDGGDGGDGAQPEVWSVAALNRSVRHALESQWSGVWVQGEIADFTRARTGHIYFSLNDEDQQAQLRAVMFASDARRARAKLEPGARVRLFGRLSLYEPRGSFQFIAQRAMPAGAGNLAAQLRRLIAKLEKEGLTDPARKRPLPLLPRTVGVVSSEHGAAIHDILRVSRGRCPVRLVLAPCRVQGAEAPREIIAALEAVQRVPGLDVILLARGGGSAEDLWAFNDEALARAVAAARVPVVSGVGHETDVTLCDLVADVRAATPSNAAELALPERDGLVERVQSLDRRVARALEVRLGRERMRLGELEKRMSDPRIALRAHTRALSQLDARLVRAARARIAAPRVVIEGLRKRLAPHAPQERLRVQRAALGGLNARLAQTPRALLRDKQRRLAALDDQLRARGPSSHERGRRHMAELSAKLSALSPLSVLSRGYAIALHEQTGKALVRADDAKPGDRVKLRLHQGELHARVEEK